MFTIGTLWTTTFYLLGPWLISYASGNQPKLRVAKDDWLRIHSRTDSTKFIYVKLFMSSDTWEGALNTCHQEKSHLLPLDVTLYRSMGFDSPLDVTQKLVQYITNQGLNTHIGTNIWVGMHLIHDKLWWEYSQPIPVKLSDNEHGLWWWKPGQFNHPFPGDCGMGRAVLNSGQVPFNPRPIEVSMQDCNTSKPFICFTEGFDPVNTKVDGCDTDWVGNYNHDSCLWYSDSSLSFYDADDTCRSMGAHLAAPTTNFMHSFIIDVVQEEASPPPIISCYTCHRASSEEHCLDTGALLPCPQGSYCETQVVVTPLGTIQIDKYCQVDDVCENNHQRSEYECHAAAQDDETSTLSCYDCCKQSECNKIIAGKGSLAAALINGPSDSSSSPVSTYSPITFTGRRKKRQVGQLQVPTVWIGLRVYNDNFQWSDGTPWNPAQSRINPSSTGHSRGCFLLNTHKEIGREWVIVNCGVQYHFVCQKHARPRGRSAVVKNPSDIRTSSAYVDIQNPRSTSSHFNNPGSDVTETVHGLRPDRPSPTLQCNITNCHPDYPVLWVKDGIFMQTTLPPGGFKLNLRTHAVHRQMKESNSELNPGVVQGSYHCEAWTLNPFRRLASRPALVTLSDVITFRGQLKLADLSYDGSVNGPFNHLVHTEAEISNIFNEMISNLASLPNRRHFDGLYPVVQFSSIREGSTILVFSIYYFLPTLEPKRLHDMILNMHEDTIPNPPPNWTLLESFTHAFQVALTNSMKQKIREPTSNWSRKYGSYGATEDGLEIRNTQFCVRDIYAHGDRRLWFDTARVGEMAFSHQICMADGLPLANRRCVGDFTEGVHWSDIEWYERCSEAPSSVVTHKLQQISETPVESSNVDTITDHLDVLTRDPSLLTYSDVILTSMVIENLVYTRKPSKTVGDKVISAVDRLLQVSFHTIKEADKITRTSSRVVESLERFADNADLGAEPHARIVKPNVALEMWDLSNVTKPAKGIASVINQGENLDQSTILSLFDITEVKLGDTDAAILLSDEVIERAQRARGGNLRGNIEETFESVEVFVSSQTRLRFAIFQNNLFFRGESRETSSRSYVNSRVISAAVNGMKIENLTHPIQTLFLPLNETAPSRVHCVFWDEAANYGHGNWSEEGCVYVQTVEGRIICQCNHLTNFAVLVDPERISISRTHQMALSLISTIGLVLSIVGLSLVVITFLVFRKLRKGRTQKVLFNLALALLCADIVFLVGIERTENYIGCIVVAVLLHYFLLAAFMWMLVESILQYLKFVKVLDTYVQNFMIKASIPAWLIPLVPVCIVLSMNYDLYRGHRDFCWLELHTFYFAFLTPVACIIVINAIFFILVIKGITCDRPKGMRSNQSERSIMLLQIRAGICCFVVLGVTWVFGFLAISDAKLLFQYLFCIFNAFQGFFIFVLHCAREQTVRDSWRKLCCSKKMKAERKISSTTSTSLWYHKGSPGDKLASGGLNCHNGSYDNGYFRKESVKSSHC